MLKQAFSIFVVKLYGFCLSIAYIARQRLSDIVLVAVVKTMCNTALLKRFCL